MQKLPRKLRGRLPLPSPPGFPQNRRSSAPRSNHRSACPSSTTRRQNSGALRIPCSSRTNQAGKLKQKSNPTTIRGVSFAISISHSATSARVLPASSRTLTFPPASSVQTPAQICRRCPAASTRPDQSIPTTRCTNPASTTHYPLPTTHYSLSSTSTSSTSAPHSRSTFHIVFVENPAPTSRRIARAISLSPSGFFIRFRAT